MNNFTLKSLIFFLNTQFCMMFFVTYAFAVYENDITVKVFKSTFIILHLVCHKYQWYVGMAKLDC